MRSSSSETIRHASAGAGSSGFEVCRSHSTGSGSTRSACSTTWSRVQSAASKSSQSCRKGRPRMARARRSEILKRVPLSEVKDDLSRYLRRAAEAPIIVTRHGRPAGVLIGFASEDDWFDYQLENDPRFVRRVQRARDELRSGRGVPINDV